MQYGEIPISGLLEFLSNIHVAPLEFHQDSTAKGLLQSLLTDGLDFDVN